MMKFYYCLFLFPVLSFATSASVSVSENGIYDFGKYPANLQKTHRFKISNTTSKILILGKIRSTCGCMVGSLTKTELPKGESSEISVVVKPNSVAGAYSKAIYVETNDPAERFLRLVVNGETVPLLKVQPDSLLYVGSLKAGKEYVYQFKLICSNPADMENVKLKLPDLSQSKQGKLSLELDPANWTLTLKVIPTEKSNFFNADFDIHILAPSGWPPLHFKLYGRVQ